MSTFTVLSTTPLIVRAPLDCVDANPYQTRPVTAASVQGLAADIRANGLQQRPAGRWHPAFGQERIQLKFGHRRLEAYRVLSADSQKFAAIEIELDDYTDQQMHAAVIVENKDRENLTPPQEAAAFKSYMDTWGAGIKNTAALFGMKPEAAHNLLRMLDLPLPVQAMVDGQQIPERLARSLASASRLPEKDVLKVAKVIAKAAPDEKEEQAATALEDLYNDHGRRLTPNLWDKKWLATPLVIENPIGDLTELRACSGCDFFVKYQGSEFCLRPECHDTKGLVWAKREAERVSKKNGIAVAGPDEAVTTYYDGTGYDYAARRQAEKLVSAKLACLRLVPDFTASLKSNGGYGLEAVTGSRMVVLATTNKAEADRYLSASTVDKKAIAKAVPAKPLSTAAQQKLKAAEAKERAERRQAKSAFLRSKCETLWLLETVAQAIAAKLDVHGRAAFLFEDTVTSQYQVSHALYPDFHKLAGTYQQCEDWECDIDDRAIDDPELREDQALTHAVLCVLGHSVLPQYNMTPEEAFDFPQAKETIVPLAARFGVKLPAGWDKPPVFKTAYNCHTCGVFGSREGSLTKAELAEGWVVEQAGDIVATVTCPECKAHPAAPARKRSK